MKAKKRVIDPRMQAQLQEALREVHVVARLENASVDENGRTTRELPRSAAIGVTSPDYSDGKTTVAMALAGSLSRDFGGEVALVDADFLTHSVDEEFDLQGLHGFTEVLTGSSSIEDVSYRKGSMRVIPSGRASAEPGRMIRSERFASAISELKAANGFVVLDLPATLRSMTAPALAQQCDGVIVVVRHGQTTRQELDRTLHLLKDSHILGIVVNRRTTSVPRWVQGLLAMRP